jgi:Ca2+-binding RTX toxin-like protein
MARKTHNITKDQDSTLVVRSNADTWNIAKSVTFETHDDAAIHIIAVARDNIFSIDGDLQSGIRDSARNSTINIGANSQITAVNGIYENGSDAEIHNAGNIDGSETGIHGGTAAIFNTGIIHGGNTGILSDTGGKVTNHGDIDGVVGVQGMNVVNGKDGYISGTDTGVFTLRLVNYGLISSEDGIAVEGGGNLINRGTIDGDILMGPKGTLQSFNGTIHGTVFGGSEGNHYEISQNLNIVEKAGGFADTVDSTIDYTLGANLEILNLVGKGDLDGHGNDGWNNLNGNAGDNHLFGEGGSDTLDGRKGDDVLTGGEGADTFVFAKGDRVDTIADFTDGEDLIDAQHYNLDEVLHSIKQRGDDVWIYFGHGDRLVIENADHKDFDSTDFYQIV